MTEEGFLKAKKLFEIHFAKEMKTLPFPKLSGVAQKRWNQVPEMVRKDIMDQVWCTHCRNSTPVQLREGEKSGRFLVLQGTCKKCGSKVSRVIEPDEDRGYRTSLSTQPRFIKSMGFCLTPSLQTPSNGPVKDKHLHSNR
jgi:hypothetical protein